MHSALKCTVLWNLVIYSCGTRKRVLYLHMRKVESKCFLSSDSCSSHDITGRAPMLCRFIRGYGAVTKRLQGIHSDVPLLSETSNSIVLKPQCEYEVNVLLAQGNSFDCPLPAQVSYIPNITCGGGKGESPAQSPGGSASVTSDSPYGAARTNARNRQVPRE